MDYESRLAISNYKEIACLNKEHKVYIAQNNQTNKIYVKKYLDVYNLSIYKQLKNSSIKGIPKIYELCEEENILILIEEYISGQTLEEVISSGHSFSYEQLLDISLKVSQITLALHTQNPAIIHRDIKPSNVMLTESGDIVLLDLNAAKNPSDSTKSEDTSLLGTKGYAAPEQYGFGCSDERTDIYAIGELMRDMFSHMDSSSEINTNKLSTIIDKCTQLSPSNRYSKVNELIKAIGSLIPTNTPYTAYKTPKRFYPLLPPGFRSLNPFHMIPATLIYGFIFWLSAGLTTNNQTSISIIVFERLFIWLMFMLVVFFTGNYQNIQSHLLLCRSQNMFLRIVGIIIGNLFIIFGTLLLMTLCESIVKSI